MDAPTLLRTLRAAIDGAELRQTRVMLFDCTDHFAHKDNGARSLEHFSCTRLVRAALQIVRRTEANARTFDRLVHFLKDNRRGLPGSGRVELIVACGTTVGLCANAISPERIADLVVSILRQEAAIASTSKRFEELVQEVEIVRTACAQLVVA